MSEGGRDAYDAGGIEGLMSHKSNVQKALSQPDWGSKLGDNAKNAIFAELARRGYAEGGEVQLRGSTANMSVPAGGIASVPTEYSQTPAMPGQAEIQMVAAAILGQIDNAEQIINAFVEKYGPEQFMALRKQVLQMTAPGAQTEGVIRGQGGGMDDQVGGTIAGQQDIAVSPGEYIVPADVVSGLGDGSTDAGAQQLDGMSKRVRMARGGTVQQPQRLTQRMTPV
jgi:hypothetical protein